MTTKFYGSQDATRRERASRDDSINDYGHSKNNTSRKPPPRPRSTDQRRRAASPASRRSGDQLENSSQNGRGSIPLKAFVEPHLDDKFRGKIVTIYRNGNQYDQGAIIGCSESQFPTWRTFLKYLNTRVRLPAGPVNKLFAVDGTEIKRIADMNDHGAYVVVTENFVPTNYGAYSRNSWKITNKLPTPKEPAGLDSLESEYIIEHRDDFRFRRPTLENKRVHQSRRPQSIGPDGSRNRSNGNAQSESSDPPDPPLKLVRKANQRSDSVPNEKRRKRKKKPASRPTNSVTLSNSDEKENRQRAINKQGKRSAKDQEDMMDDMLRELSAHSHRSMHDDDDSSGFTLGKRQSPVDIRTTEAQFDESLENAKFYLNYNSAANHTLKNTGITFQLAPRDNDLSSRLKVSFRPKEEFIFAQMHAHWGGTKNDGTEHTFDGKGYAMEIHIVHCNAKYKTFQQAISEPDGLLVLGILCEIGGHNDDIEPLCELLEEIPYRGDATYASDFNVAGVLPKNMSKFYTYDGSLTSPPYNEAVIWIVFAQKLQISEEQVNKFRNLHAVTVKEKQDPRKIQGHVRRTQALNNRPIYASFEK